MYVQRFIRRFFGSRFRRRSSNLRSAIEADEREFFSKNFRSTYLLIGVVAIVSFSVVDFMYSPKEAQLFLLMRLASIPVAAVCWLSYKIEKVREEFYFWPALFAATYTGILMWFVASRSGFEASIHFGGLLLAFSFWGTQFPWRTRHLPLLFLLVAGPFWWGVFARWPQVDKPLVLGELMICLGAISLTLMYYATSRVARRKDCLHRVTLERRNRVQKLVIQRKTREGVYLERLASQFSPQVVDSIKNGTLDLESRRRRPVACIFVDVQNSTARASRIDHHNYTELMAAFFEECVKIFLQHNVTVGTYLGDGILAFTNAPNDDPEYLRNALTACLDILALHRKKQRIYFATWRTEFNIRIGINAGYATVGFFPSRKHGTYTALGETVSLAARLCARADVNSVAVTKKILTSISLAESTLQISQLKMAADIKGLEGESFEVFNVRPPEAASLPIDHCPNCAIPMSEESRQLGASFFSCSRCGFRELLPKKSKEQDDFDPGRAA